MLGGSAAAAAHQAGAGLAKGQGVIAAGAPADILTNVEALRRTNIDPPVLTELFLKLRDQGLSVEIPLNIDQAVRDLLSAARA